jgi:hypothetical protein
MMEKFGKMAQPGNSTATAITTMACVGSDAMGILPIKSDFFALYCRPPFQPAPPSMTARSFSFMGAIYTDGHRATTI